MSISLQLLSCDTIDSIPCVIISTENARYVFDIGIWPTSRHHRTICYAVPFIMLFHTNINVSHALDVARCRLHPILHCQLIPLAAERWAPLSYTTHGWLWKWAIEMDKTTVLSDIYGMVFVPLFYPLGQNDPFYCAFITTEQWRQIITTIFKRLLVVVYTGYCPAASHWLATLVPSTCLFRRVLLINTG